MRIVTVIIMILTMIFCIGNGKSTDKNAAGETGTKKDTLLYYWQPDFHIYSFDTVINQTSYQMKTYCLNDSAVYNETFSEERSKNENLIEFSVAHNFATDHIIKTNKKEIKLHLRKESFKDSLSADFLKICHMWKNEFSHEETGQLIYRATFAQPDTDYQIAILYLITDKGELQILKVNDESYNGSIDE